MTKDFFHGGPGADNDSPLIAQLDLKDASRKLPTPPRKDVGIVFFEPTAEEWQVSDQRIASWCLWYIGEVGIVGSICCPLQPCYE